MVWSLGSLPSNRYIRKWPAAKAGSSLDCGFPGLKAGASTRRAARNTSGTGAEARLIGGCGTTQVGPCYEAQGLKPGMVWSLGSLPSNRYIRKWPAAKAGGSLDCGFPGLKAGASTHRAARNTQAQGLKPGFVWSLDGTTEVVPCHKGSGAEAHRISAAVARLKPCPVTKAQGLKPGFVRAWMARPRSCPFTKARGLKPGMVWSLGSLPSNRYIRELPAAKAGGSLDRGFPGLKAGASTHRAGSQHLRLRGSSPSDFGG
jgi:hypothetical protein